MAVPKRPLRILAYSDSSVYSGAEIVFARILEDMSRRSRLSIALAVGRQNDELRAAAQPHVERIIPVVEQRTRLSALHLYDPARRLALRRALGDERCDVLLVNLPTSEYGATPLLARVGRGAVTVGILHIHQSLSSVGFRLGSVRERLAATALRRLDCLCALSPWAEAEARRWLRAGAKTAVMPMPVPRVRPVQRADARRLLDLPDGPVVGIAGRISIAQKGHDTFVDAAALLAERDPAIRFAVAGSGPDEGRVATAIARRRLGDRFHLLGPVRPIDVFLSAIDALAIPSRFEGMPLIALEALWLGTPGVASAIDGLAQLWPRPWQVAPDDAQGFADQLSVVLATAGGERTRVLAEAQANVEERVSDDVGSFFEDLIRSAIHAPGASAS